MAKKIRPKKYEVYFDESGLPDGNPGGHFTLIACVIEKGNIEELNIRLQQFKEECFGNKNIILHLMDIHRKQNDFAIGKVTNSQIAYFKKNIPKFLEKQKVIIFSATIDKERLHKYFKSPKDDYSIAFSHIMKSIYHFIDDEKVEQIDIYLESRNETSNFKVQKSFFNTFFNGNLHLEIKQELRKKIKRFVFKYKSDNISGLQLADIICSPIKTIRVYGSDPEQLDKKTDISLEVDIFNSIRNKFYNPLDFEDIKNWSFKKVPVIKKPGIWTDTK